MDAIDTMIREGNVKTFLSLNGKRYQEIVASARISSSHTRQMLKLWVSCGLVVKVDDEYVYTERGERVRYLLEGLKKEAGGRRV